MHIRNRAFADRRGYLIMSLSRITTSPMWSLHLSEINNIMYAVKMIIRMPIFSVTLYMGLYAYTVSLGNHEPGNCVFDIMSSDCRPNFLQIYTARNLQQDRL